MSLRKSLDAVRINWISMLIATATIILYGIVLALKPELFEKTLTRWGDFFIFFAPFAVAIIGVLGFVDAHVPPETVARYIGDKRKIHGYLFAVLFGTIVSTSHYAVFPTMKLLRKKGARTAILATFMVAWSGISLSALPLELQLFGTKFVFLRLALTTIGALVFGFVTGILNIHMER